MTTPGASERPAPPQAVDEQPPDEPLSWIGRELDGRYRILEVLGEGGMGAVFVAEQLALRKQVALKVIRPELAGDGEMAARFAREAMASAKLDHPHVAAALDYGTLPEGGAYLVMQLVRGRSLADLIMNEGALPWARATGLAAQVADALAAAHAAGIVHRDLKPENILLEPRDDGSELVKVLDFGIASVSMDDGPAPEGAAPRRALTRVGMVMGTPGYMSPEQAMGEKVDERADLYSLGVILWECVMGVELFPGTELPAIVSKQLTEAAPDVGVVDGPPALSELVAALLARAPDARPESASTVRDALRQMTYRNSAAGPVTGSLPRVDPVSGEVSLPPFEPSLEMRLSSAVHERAPTLLAPATPAGPRKKTLLLAAAIGGAGLVLVAGLSVGLYLTFSDGGPGRPGVMTQARRVAEPEVPHAVQVKIDRMVQGTSQSTRRSAGRWLTEHEPSSEVPAWARAVGELEIARGCRTRRQALSAIRELGDVRALPSVERYHQSPHRGCGLLRQSDCYGCVRDELVETVQALGGDPNSE